MSCKKNLPTSWNVKTRKRNEISAATMIKANSIKIIQVQAITLIKVNLNSEFWFFKQTNLRSYHLI